MEASTRKPDPSVKPFAGHLEDLRRALTGSAICLVAGIAVAIPLAPRVLAWVTLPHARSGVENPLRLTQVAGGMHVLLTTVAWTGLLLALPLILVVVARFVFPGLTRRERILGRRAVFASVGLFAAGVWMGWQWTVPVALRLMARIEAWMGTPAAFWDTAGYAAFVLKLLLAFGLAFQLPLLVYLLGAIGVVHSRQLRAVRRHVIVGLLVIAMFLTPPDPFTMVLMAAPLIALYEICIWLIRMRELARRG